MLNSPDPESTDAGLGFLELVQEAQDQLGRALHAALHPALSDAQLIDTDGLMIPTAPLTPQEDWNRTVLRMARTCPYPEWMLLELPNGMWAAFWGQGFDSIYCREIAEGRFRAVCAYRSRVKDRVLSYMARHRLE